MGFFRALLATTAVRADGLVRRGLLLLTVYLLSILLLAGGVGLLLFGFYLWTFERLGNPAALLITACLLLWLALILVLVWLFAGRPTVAVKASGELPGGELKDLETDVDRLAQDLDRVVRRHAPAFALGAFVVGLVVGVSPKLRRGMLQWLR